MKVILLTEVSHLSPVKVIRGEKMDKGWVFVENDVVGPNVTLRTGSVIEKDNEWAKIGIKEGLYAQVESHTELEKVFPDVVLFLNKQSPLSEVLRAHRITCLEQVVNNIEGSVPFTDGKRKNGTPITVREILKNHLSTEQIEERIKKAKEIIQ